MKKCVLLGWLILLGMVVSAAPAPDTASSRRIIGGATIDLAPLIKWEKNRKGDRPLTNWFHIQGKLLSCTAEGFRVQAQLGNASARQQAVIVRNGPTREAAEFDRLESQLQELNREKGQLEKAASRPVIARNGPAQKGNKNNNDPKRNEVAKSKADLQRVNGHIKDLQKQLASYPSADGKFKVDCYAFRTGQQFEGMPVYDCGFPVPQ